MSTALTERQSDLLAFLKATTREDEVGPSFDEMAVAMGLSSKHGIYRLINALEERGHIIRKRGRARSIKVIDRCKCPHCGGELT